MKQFLEIIEIIKKLPPPVLYVGLGLFLTICLLIFLLRHQINFGKIIGAITKENKWSEIFGAKPVEVGMTLRTMATMKMVIEWRSDHVSIPDKKIFKKDLSDAIQQQRLNGNGMIINLVMVKKAPASFWDVMIEAMEDVIDKNNIHVLIVCPVKESSSENMNNFYKRIADRVGNKDSESIEIKRDSRENNR